MAVHGYDLVIVGAGSGNMLPVQEFAGWRVAVVESGRFGGTCLNRGCIPSKMLVHTADVAQTVRHAGRFGIRVKWVGADWPAIRERVFGRIDPLHEQAVAHRHMGGIDVFPGEARFVAPKALRVGDDEIHAERFVLAACRRTARAATRACIAAAGRSTAGRGASIIRPRPMLAVVTMTTGAAQAASAAICTLRLGSWRSTNQVQNATSASESA